MTAAAVQLYQIPVADEAKIDSDAFKNVVKKLQNASGNEASLWSSQHEDKQVIGIAAVWKSKDDQNAWASSTDGEATASAIQSLATASVYEDLVLFDEDPLPTLKAKAVELVSWIHPSDSITDEKSAKIEAGFRHFQNAILTAAQSDGGLVAGWGQVEFDHKGVPSRRWTSLIGWKSVEDHYACKELPVFQNVIHHLMEHDHTEVEMVHYHYYRS